MYQKTSATLILVALLGLGTLPATAEESASPHDLGWHIVRPGDTLQEVTNLYVGTHKLWQESWKRNPQIEDPHWIFPGQRLHVSLDTGLPEGVARVLQCYGEVDAEPRPLRWRQAQDDDLLQGGDALRTVDRASAAELLFADGSKMAVTEGSLIYLRELGERLEATSVPRDEIEILAGQADFVRRQRRFDNDVEIVIGSARAQPRRDPAGISETRARKAAADQAQLMVYAGSSVVAAAGSSVDVPAGMGTAVPADGPPRPAEALLPRPVLAVADGQSFPIANPVLAWDPVPGTASYLLELCVDAECALARERIAGLEDPRYQPAGLAAGPYRWRVTAIAASGLDGYPSEVRRFSITGDATDRTPPQGRLRIPSGDIAVGSRIYVGAQAEIEVLAEDEGSGVAGWTAVLDGQEGDAELFQGPWPEGAHQATAMVFDQAGNRATLEPLSWISDLSAPRIRLAEGGETPSGGRPSARSAASSKRKPESSLLWSDDGARWRSLAISPTADRIDGGEKPSPQVSQIVSDRPTFLLRSVEEGWLRGETDVAVSPSRSAVVQVADDGVGVGRLRFWVQRSADGAEELVLEAVDLLGNTRQATWSFQPGGTDSAATTGG